MANSDLLYFLFAKRLFCINKNLDYLYGLSGKTGFVLKAKLEQKHKRFPEINIKLGKSSTQEQPKMVGKPLLKRSTTG